MTEDADLELLQDHEQSIRKLEEDIVAVNQIFKDLGMLVHEQADVIDSIEANIESASMNVVRGTEHVRQARSHLVKVRRRKCYIAVAVVIILAVLIIIIGVAASR